MHSATALSQQPDAQSRRRYLDLLRQGIEAAQANDKPRARSLLRQAIGLHGQEEISWLWLASVAENQTETYVCMERVLDINPTSEQARNWVDRAQELGIPSPIRKAAAETQGIQKPEQQSELFAADETVFLGNASDLFGDTDG